MAFVRRKGNSFYLVHNVRRGDKVRQLHLARLGQRARITDDVVKEVSKKHPFVELNWRALRDQFNHAVNLADPNSPAVRRLISSIRSKQTQHGYDGFSVGAALEDCGPGRRSAGAGGPVPGVSRRAEFARPA